ncbi:MAG: hypothetical protein ACK6DC_05960 [Planctomycetota bacterium]|jgi:hypothetical protein
MLKFPSRIGLICSSIACIALVGHPLAAQEKSKIPNALNRTVQDSEEESEPKEKGEDPLMQFPLEPERWIDMAYGALGGTRVSFEQSHRRKVRVTLNQIEQLVGVSDEVREKVKETAELEFQRLDADISALANSAPRRPSQAYYQTFYQKLGKIIEPYQQMMHVGFQVAKTRPKALWEKVLGSNLTDEQSEIVENDDRQRAAYSHRVQRLETLLQISRVLGLSSKQRKDLEGVADANPDAWISLEVCWTTLAAMPESQQKEYFTESQRIRLTRPLEYTNDLRPVMVWDMPQ